MAQASKAILPKDAGGPWGQRIGVTIGGSLDWTLVVGAYQTKRVKSTDLNRYSLVVLNWYVCFYFIFRFSRAFLALRTDAASSGTIIRLARGTHSLSKRLSRSAVCRYAASSLLLSDSELWPTNLWLHCHVAKAKYTFAVGVTTLWWFAAPQSLRASDDGDVFDTEIYAQNGGEQVPMRMLV